MKDKIILITGANTGIGKAAAEALARMSGTIVMMSRNLQRGEEARRELIERTGHQQIDLMTCDLASLEDIRKFSSDFHKKYDRLDVLINNAGIFVHERMETADGFEYQIGVNHLGPFLLTSLLLDLLKKSGEARIINVSSAAHLIGKINFDDLHLEKSYNPWKSYAQSKLANVLFTYELSRRLNGDGITVNALHPGLVKSRFSYDRRTEKPDSFIKLGEIISITPEKGAETTVFLATSPEVSGMSGGYYVRKKAKRTSKASYDQKTAAKLWDVSTELTRAKF
jgi:NAD(P)-dependent dehydrogenase (short-subunit alcohol dehydrogenase family)